MSRVKMAVNTCSVYPLVSAVWRKVDIHRCRYIKWLFPKLLIILLIFNTLKRTHAVSLKILSVRLGADASGRYRKTHYLL